MTQPVKDIISVTLTDWPTLALPFPVQAMHEEEAFFFETHRNVDAADSG